MSTRADGGTAFPVTWQDGDGQMVAVSGMILRDFFAAKAMAAYVGSDYEGAAANKVARWAYENADAMLAARLTPEQQSPTPEGSAPGEEE